jgi:hypothetical protein
LVWLCGFDGGVGSGGGLLCVLVGKEIGEEELVLHEIAFD